MTIKEAEDTNYTKLSSLTVKTPTADWRQTGNHGNRRPYVRRPIAERPLLCGPRLGRGTKCCRPNPSVRPSRASDFLKMGKAVETSNLVET